MQKSCVRERERVARRGKEGRKGRGNGLKMLG